MVGLRLGAGGWKQPSPHSPSRSGTLEGEEGSVESETKDRVEPLL